MYAHVNTTICIRQHVLYATNLQLMWMQEKYKHRIVINGVLVFCLMSINCVACLHMCFGYYYYHYHSIFAGHFSACKFHCFAMPYTRNILILYRQTICSGATDFVDEISPVYNNDSGAECIWFSALVIEMISYSSVAWIPIFNMMWICSMLWWNNTRAYTLTQCMYVIIYVYGCGVVCVCL